MVRGTDSTAAGRSRGPPLPRREDSGSRHAGVRAAATAARANAQRSSPRRQGSPQAEDRSNPGSAPDAGAQRERVNFQPRAVTGGRSWADMARPKSQPSDKPTQPQPQPQQQPAAEVRPEPVVQRKPLSRADMLARFAESPERERPAESEPRVQPAANDAEPADAPAQPEPTPQPVEETQPEAPAEQQEEQVTANGGPTTIPPSTSWADIEEDDEQGERREEDGEMTEGDKEARKGRATRRFDEQVQAVVLPIGFDVQQACPTTARFSFSGAGVDSKTLAEPTPSHAPTTQPPAVQGAKQPQAPQRAPMQPAPQQQPPQQQPHPSHMPAHHAAHQQPHMQQMAPTHHMQYAAAGQHVPPMQQQYNRAGWGRGDAPQGGMEAPESGPYPTSSVPTKQLPTMPRTVPQHRGFSGQVMPADFSRQQPQQRMLQQRMRGAEGYYAQQPQQAAQSQHQERWFRGAFYPNGLPPVMGSNGPTPGQQMGDDAAQQPVSGGASQHHWPHATAQQHPAHHGYAQPYGYGHMSAMPQQPVMHPQGMHMAPDWRGGGGAATGGFLRQPPMGWQGRGTMQG